MKTTYWMTAVMAAVIGLTAVSAQAQGRDDHDGRHGEQHGMMFGELDADGDGQLTLEEMTARHMARFVEADSDGDGLLSAAELSAAAQARHADRTARMIERMDRNDDGLLSPEEMQGRRDPARMFERVDANDDGMVSEEEFADAGRKMRGHHGKGHHGKGRHDRDDN